MATDLSSLSPRRSARLLRLGLYATSQQPPRHLTAPRERARTGALGGKPFLFSERDARRADLAQMPTRPNSFMRRSARLGSQSGSQSGFRPVFCLGSRWSFPMLASSFHLADGGPRQSRSARPRADRPGGRSCARARAEFGQPRSAVLPLGQTLIRDPAIDGASMRPPERTQLFTAACFFVSSAPEGRFLVQAGMAPTVIEIAARQKLSLQNRESRLARRRSKTAA